MEGVGTSSPTSHDAAPAGVAGRAASLLAAGLAAYAIYWVLFIVQPQVYRVSFLLIALSSSPSCCIPATAGLRLSDRVPPYDWMLVALAVIAFTGR